MVSLLSWVTAGSPPVASQGPDQALDTHTLDAEVATRSVAVRPTTTQELL